MTKSKKISVLFLIPDITGFTRFMTSADQDFAHYAIPKILKSLAKANRLDFSIAEIEGDAIFFYKTGRLPAIYKVAEQCKVIFNEFNRVIDSFRESDPEYFEKYLSQNQLGLKIIVHCGKISISRIEGRTKLIGEDVILAHKLLKNKITIPNYILLSENYLNKLKDKKVVNTWFNWEKLKNGHEDYDHFETVNYNYISLNECNNISCTF